MLKGISCLSALFPDGVSFIVATPPYIRLREQTKRRLSGAGLLGPEDAVLVYGNAGVKCEASAFTPATPAKPAL